MFLWLGIMGASAQEDKCDVNGDGVVNIADVVYVVDHVLGKHHHYPMTVDLGLPSGTQWASCNVGASKPEEYGSYFSWGEIKEKDNFTWETYTHCDGSEQSCHFLGSDISGTEYDVVHMKWGGNWCMPNRDDYDELVANCTFKWTTYNGVDGYLFTSKKNRNSIFFPGAGSKSGNIINDGAGRYWISNNTSKNYQAISMLFSEYYLYVSHPERRYLGLNIRPVVRK